jgi:hypothetical protein
MVVILGKGKLRFRESNTVGVQIDVVSFDAGRLTHSPMLSKSIISSSTSGSATRFPFATFPSLAPPLLLTLPLLVSLRLLSSSSSSPNRKPLPFIRRFSSEEKVECAVPEAKFEDAESSPSIQEKFDDVRCGLERGERWFVGCSCAGFATIGGEVGRGLGADEMVGIGVAVAVDSVGGSIETGVAVELRSGNGDAGAGNAKVSAAFSLATCSVDSSGNGIDESSR